MSVTPRLVRYTDREGNQLSGIVVQDSPTAETDGPEGTAGLTVIAIFGADSGHATVEAVPAGTDPLPETASGTFETDFDQPTPVAPVAEPTSGFEPAPAASSEEIL